MFITPDANRNNYMATVMKHNALLLRSCVCSSSLFHNLDSLHITTAKRHESHREQTQLDAINYVEVEP